MGKTTVTKDSVDSTTETGIYGHSASLFDGGNFGVLLVFQNVYLKYIAQIDICSNRKMFYRFGFNHENQVSWGEWMTHS